MKHRYGTKLVMDICDNPFFGHSNNGVVADKSAKRQFLVEALNQFDAIVTPSHYLREKMAEHLRSDMKYVFIPDAIEAEPAVGAIRKWTQRKPFRHLAQLESRYDQERVERGRRLVWFGDHGRESAKNGLYDIERISDFLADHNDEKPLSLTIISNNEDRYTKLFAGKPFRSYYQAWNYYTINRTLRLHDIALIPVTPSEFSLAKSANRLSMAFENGLAVCASSIGSYEPFKGIAVFDDWDAGLRRLMACDDLRHEMVSTGREKNSDFTQVAVSMRWRQLFHELL